MFAIFISLPWPLSAREKDTTQYGMGLIANIPYPVAEVVPVVQDVVQNGIIRGTKEYNKDEYVSGAVAASSSKVFGPWTEGGQVFYKVRMNAIDPRNFKNSGDVGTLAVRYVLQPQGDKNTVIHIDARFVEDFRRVSHPSNGSVEGAEYKDIRDRIETQEAMKSQGIEAQKERAANAGKKPGQPEFSSSATTSTTAEVTNSVPSLELPAASTSAMQPQPPVTLEERVHNLKQQVERVVKAPGAPLKSAPFHTASVLQSLSAGTDVLIVISTPYWLGVETHDGQHGWILRDELEQVP
ncbi:MAG: SH3 domain-containing protein [Candidatus Sulfotelmatobacter sp.]